MDCPRCKSPMREVLYEEVHIDTCDSCEGEWLDAGEMKKINAAREVKFTPQEISIVKGIGETVQIEERDIDQDTLCPHCAVPMRQFNYASMSGVLIDKCPDCAGIWLDKNELEQVQILVEGWASKMQDDQEKYGNLMQKIKDDIEHCGDISRSPMMNVLIARYLGLLGI